MFRVFGGVLRALPWTVSRNTNIIKNRCNSSLLKIQNRQFSCVQHHLNNQYVTNTSLLTNQKIQQIANTIPTRTLTKFSWKKGKRKTVKSVIRRFYRLHWGGWIRTKVGRHKKLWKKSPQRKRRLRQHVFCNGQQNTLLDLMVTKYWKKPKYYVNDPYAPYHVREEWRYTYKEPRPYFPKEEV
ncbi:structural constituent of ribosome [Trypoxylus dichotomus]